MQKKHTSKESERRTAPRFMFKRKRNSELEALKKSVDSLISEGVISANSYSQAGEIIRAMLSGKKAESSDFESFSKCGKCVSEKCNRISQEINDFTEAESEIPQPQNHISQEINDFPQAENEIPQPQNHISQEIHDFPQAENEIPQPQNHISQEINDFPQAESEIPQHSENSDCSDCSENSETEEQPQDDDEASVTSLSKADLDAICSSFLKLLEDYIDSKDSENLEDNLNHADIQAADKRNAIKNISSTAFSTKSATSASNGFKLTPNQRSIAEKAGIPYDEYAELLRDIPKNSKLGKKFF